MPTHALTVQLLAWVAERPRTYGETMEAWRTTCPRLTIWEDAVRDGLLTVAAGASMQAAPVMLTARGQALLLKNHPTVLPFGQEFAEAPGGHS